MTGSGRLLYDTGFSCLWNRLYLRTSGGIITEKDCSAAQAAMVYSFVLLSHPFLFFLLRVLFSGLSGLWGDYSVDKE